MTDKYVATSAHIEALIQSMRTQDTTNIVAVTVNSTGVTTVLTLPEHILDKVLKQELADAKARERKSRNTENAMLFGYRYGSTVKIEASKVNPYSEYLTRVEEALKH